MNWQVKCVGTTIYRYDKSHRKTPPSDFAPSIAAASQTFARTIVVAITCRRAYNILFLTITYQNEESLSDFIDLHTYFDLQR